MEDTEDNTIYKVVVNHEERYSIWLVKKPNPFGWEDAGKEGQKSDCLVYQGSLDRYDTAKLENKMAENGPKD